MDFDFAEIPAVDDPVPFGRHQGTGCSSRLSNAACAGETSEALGA